MIPISVRLPEKRAFGRRLSKKSFGWAKFWPTFHATHLLSSALALKGGTALNLCFGTPTRLSVDLDFNYVGSEDRAQMLADRPHIEKAIYRIAQAIGYQVQQSKDQHAGRKLFHQLSIRWR